MDRPTLLVPERCIPVPTTVSPEAQAQLAIGPMPAPRYPALDDVEAWRAMIAATDAMVMQAFTGAGLAAPAGYQVGERDLGGVRVRAISMGFNHTRGDTAFFVEPDAILVSGDVAMSALPAMGAESRISTWLASMDRFEQLKPKRIVPSHGPMGDVAFVTNYRTYLTTVRARTLALKKEGKSLEDTIKLVQDELGGKYDRNRMAAAIRVAYNET